MEFLTCRFTGWLRHTVNLPLNGKNMYCLYPKKELETDELQGPLFMKVTGAGVIIVFATRALAERFAAAFGITDTYCVVPVDELGTEATPYPDSWMKTSRAIFFDSDRTLEQYMRNRDSFPFGKHVVTLHGAVFSTGAGNK